MADETARTEQEFAADFGADLAGFLSGSTADTAEAPADNQVVDEGADTGDAAREPVVDETGRHHDPETGKFVEKTDEAEDIEEDESDPEAASEEASEGDTEEDSDDDFVIEVDDEETAERVQAVLEKYDGDPAKALIALTEAQSLIGRKGNEAQQANAELEAVKAELAEIKSGQQAVLQRMSQPMVPITQDLIDENPAAAAEQAVLQDNAQALQAAIYAWQNGTDLVDPNPDAARFFLERLALQAQMQELQATSPAAMPQATPQQELDAEVGKVLAKHPDLEKHLPAIAEAADDNPLLKRAMETGSPSERAQALEALTVIAKSRQGADTSREAMKRVQIRVKQEADDARAKARVVSASRGSAAAASQPTRVDKFFEAFDARLGLDVEKG
jgi:hypothetical protein